MKEYLKKFVINEVQTLVKIPKEYPIIGTKWIFRNKCDDQGIVIRNKERLVAQRYSQE